MVITFENVSFKYIEKKLLNQVSFSFTDQDKIGLVGINGTGKTTLLKLIMGTEKPVSGQIIKSGGMIIHMLPQDPVFEDGATIFEALMKHSLKEHPINEFEAKSILTKLGLGDFDQKVDFLSGGEKKRLALASVLVSYCDILILDEPTNHLDNELIMWLEKFLSRFKKGLLMVTHDRYFLQRVCNKMMELDDGKVYVYEANYENFLALKADRMQNEAKAQKKLKSILKKETEWLHRGVEARRTKSKSRIERIEQLNKVEFHQEREMEFSSKKTYLGKKLIQMVNGSKRYGSNLLFENFSFSLQRGDIIGVVGANGAGKSTLFKILMGEETLSSGVLEKGETLNIGYFTQKLELINPEIRVIDYIEEERQWIETASGAVSSKELLEQFLFDSDLIYSKVKMLSGGEKRRLQLVKVLMKNPNLLILDEPTNDLDIYTIELLEDYLEQFSGPILIVSHDRYFLDKLCNKLFIFDQGIIKESIDSFSEYLQQSFKKNIEFEKKDNRVKNKMPTALRNELSKLLEDIPNMEEELKNLKAALLKETTDYQRLMELNKDIENLEIKLDQSINRLFDLEEIKNNYTV